MKFLISFLLANFFISFIAANYTYGEIQGDLRKQFNFSLFIETFSGIVLYAVDCNDNKFLIEMETEENLQIFIIKFNKFVKQGKLENLCGCKYCSHATMTFVVRLHQLEVIAKCKGIDKFIRLENVQSADQISGFPLPLGYKNNKNKIYFWIGNIGYSKGLGNLLISPLKNQLIGCLDKFYFNDRIVTFEQKGEKMLKSCSNIYSESVCNISFCTVNQISYGINDCSFLSMNQRYCRKILPFFSGTKTLYEIQKRAKFPITIRVEWKQFFLKNYCLIDIKMEKNKSITIYINKMNQISFAIGINSSVVIERNLTKITDRDNNLLIIIFYEGQFMIRGASAQEIYTFIEPFQGRPMKMRIGNGWNRNICQTFEGAIGIYYDPTQIGVPTGQRHFLQSKLNIILFIGISAVFIGVFSLVLLFRRNIKKLQHHVAQVQNPNVQNVHVKCSYIKEISDPILQNSSTEECIYEVISE